MKSIMALHANAMHIPPCCEPWIVSSGGGVAWCSLRLPAVALRCVQACTRTKSDVQPPSKIRSIRRRVLSTYSASTHTHHRKHTSARLDRSDPNARTHGDISWTESGIEMPPPGPGVADQAAPPPPRSPHRGNGGATPQSPLRIKQDGKFYERLLTKESSAANLSFRYYWAEPGAVPFVWESQPGTPKDVARMAAGALPAITPPPSYLIRHRHGNNQVAASARQVDQKSSGEAARSCKKRRCRIKRVRIGFIAGIFRRLSLGKMWRRPAPMVKVSSSSRWLFSSVATETGEHSLHHQQDEIAVAAHSKQHRAVPCSFPALTLWLLRFRNSSGNPGGRNDGWAA